MEETTEPEDDSTFATLLVEGIPYIEMGAILSLVQELNEWAEAQPGDEVPKNTLRMILGALATQVYGAGLDTMTFLPDMVEFMDIEKIHDYTERVEEIQDK